MKLSILFLSLILSCNQPVHTSNKIQFLSGTYQLQTGGAAGMGPIESYTFIFLKKNLIDKIEVDSLLCRIGNGYIQEFFSASDTLSFRTSVQGPMQLQGGASTQKINEEIPEENILIFYKCNQKANILVLNKNQFKQLQHKNNE